MAKPGAIIIEGHVQGLSNARALGEAGIPVIVVDTVDCIAQHSRYCNRFIKCPDYNTDQFAHFLIALAGEENLKNWMLLPSNDHAVKTISRFKKELEETYKVITPDWHILQNIYDKVRLLKIADRVGVPVPETYLIQSVHTVAESVNQFPVLTKGRHGLTFYISTGQKAFLSENKDELISHLKQINGSVDLADTFTQELIPYNGSNKTVSFTAFSVNGEIKTHWAGIKLREHPLQFGTATFTKSVYIEECYQQSVKLLHALRYTGVCEIEYLLDPRTGEYKLIEINARTWLWVGLAKACGVDFANIIYNYLQGNEVKYPESYPVGVTWRNPVTDWVYGILGVLKGHYSMSDLYHSSLKSDVNALFQKEDMKPGWMYIVQLLSMFKNR